MKNLLGILLFTTLLISFNRGQAQTPLTEAVDFNVTDLEGNNIHLFDLLDEGKYVLIDFYFTTCVPCQDAVPKISEAYEYFGCGAYDIFFMAMDFGDSHEECVAFDEEFGVAYPSVSGIEGGGTAVCEAYQIPLYPCIVLIAPDRSIVEQNIWPIPNAESLINAIEEYGIEENDCALKADFIAYNNDICENEYMLFQDRSLGNIISWEWTFEGGIPPTSNEQNPMVLYTNPGNFDVSLTIYNEDEESTFNLEDIARVHQCTSIKDRTKAALQIYPNPSSGLINISLPQREKSTLILYNLNGELVFQEEVNGEHQILDLRHLKHGLYLIKVVNGPSQWMEYFIIQ